MFWNKKEMFTKHNFVNILKKYIFEKHEFYGKLIIYLNIIYLSK